MECMVFLKMDWLMFFDFDELECNIFGDFKVGDNVGYNFEFLSNLVEVNENGKFNKFIFF